MLDQERAVIAERFGFDVEIDEVMEALAHGGAGTRAAGLRRAEKSEPHNRNPLPKRCENLSQFPPMLNRPLAYDEGEHELLSLKSQFPRRSCA